MTRSTLTEAQTKKLASAVAKFNASQSYTKASREDNEKDAARYADKWGRWKLGIRGTGPHSHGFDAKQRNELQAITAAALGIKIEEPVKKEAAKPKKGKGKSTAALAKEQKARAQGNAKVAEDLNAVQPFADAETLDDNVALEVYTV
jgi:hypothetical protein